MLAVYHRYGRSPIALTADQPVAQAVVGFERAFALFFKLLYDRNLALFRAHTVELAGVDHHAVIGVRQPVGRTVRALHHSFYGQTEFFGEDVVALVVSGDAHNRARAVACEHVVRNEYGHFPAVDGVNRIRARHNARLFAVAGKAVNLRDLGSVVFVFFHRRFAFGCGDDVHERIFGREHDIRHAESGVRTRGENAELFLSALHRKLDFPAVRLAYPVLLHKFGLFGPVELVQPFEQLVGVIRDFEEPLRQVLAHHRGTAAFALALDDLLVCEHRVAGRTPVDGRGFAVSEPVLVKLQKQPLRPLVIFGKTGAHLVIPVIHRAYLFELFLHCRDVLHRAVVGMDARLYRIVFRRQTECVKPHWLKHFVALHPLETRVGVRGSVIVPVPRVQFCARRIGKHFKDVPFFIDSVAVELVKPGVRPDFLPLALYLSEVHTFSLKNPFQFNT